MNYLQSSSFTSQCNRKNNKINFHFDKFPPLPICKYIQALPPSATEKTIR